MGRCMWVIGKYYAILYKGLKSLLVFVSSNQLVLEPIPYGQRGENESMNCSLTRCLSQWDFPGKNTRVGCHFLLQEIFLTQGLNPGLPHCRQTLYCLSHQGRSESDSVVSNSLRPHGLHSPWNSPGPNTGVGSRSLLQGIFPTQELNQGLLLCRWIL